MRILLFAVAAFAAVHGPLQAKVRILTFHCNMPQFVELQKKTLDKFLQNKYELIVFNDAKAPEDKRAIQNTCRQLGIRCVRYRQEWHKENPLNAKIFAYLNTPGVRNTIGVPDNSLEGMTNHPSLRHCHVIQHALNHFGYAHNDIVVIMDSDFFSDTPCKYSKAFAEASDHWKPKPERRGGLPMGPLYCHEDGFFA